LRQPRRGFRGQRYRTQDYNNLKRKRWKRYKVNGELDHRAAKKGPKTARLCHSLTGTGRKKKCIQKKKTEESSPYRDGNTLKKERKKKEVVLENTVAGDLPVGVKSPESHGKLLLRRGKD